MTDQHPLAAHGLFNRRIPRYTSYPPAPVFGPDIGERFMRSCLDRLDPAQPVSVYVHIPFCERLCWFCACRTQGTRSARTVENYVETLLIEIARVGALLPDGVRMGRLHWGGGTPTILSPEMIHTLAQAIRAAFPPADAFEFSVEIDPTLVDVHKVKALAEEGMTRTSLGIQDFAEHVQAAIGRTQSFELTRACVTMLRDAGVGSLNTDIVYGLPHQTTEGILASLRQVLALDPDRLALFGYAHVPWMAKRQQMIDETTLPDEYLRHDLFTAVSQALAAGGYDPIGTDHFAKPDDGLARAARSGLLRRNFQGYTDDTCPSLIGLGASSVSSFAQGYVQNIAMTGAYAAAIRQGDLASVRGHSHSLDDRVRARAIEMLMCDFSLDLDALEQSYGTVATLLGPICDEAAARFAPYAAMRGRVLVIPPEGRPLTRIVANMFDAYADTGARYSHAS